MAESADADASSYEVGSPASVKKIPGKYLSRVCDNLSDILGVGRLRRPTGQRAERSEAGMLGGKGRKKAWDRKRRTKEA